MAPAIATSHLLELLTTFFFPLEANTVSYGPNSILPIPLLVYFWLEAMWHVPYAVYVSPQCFEQTIAEKVSSLMSQMRINMIINQANYQ